MGDMRGKGANQPRANITISISAIDAAIEALKEDSRELHMAARTAKSDAARELRRRADQADFYADEFRTALRKRKSPQ